MRTDVYDKLVRDGIPDMARARGATPSVRVADDGEYLRRLTDKLREETAEFCDSGEPEELADILEVVYALGTAKGLSAPALEDLREKKREARGGFDGRIILESVTEPD